MRFDYRKIPTLATPKKNWIRRPFLQVSLFNGNTRTNVVCLVDSGADDCIFHASVARLLGIDLTTGPTKGFSGIAKGHPITGYRHTVGLQVYGMPERVEIDVYFTEAEGVDAILGQTGFFENFKVIFEQYRGQFEVEARPTAVTP